MFEYFFLQTKELIKFRNMWRRHNGQSAVLKLNLPKKSRSIDAKIKFQQGDEVEVNVHVMEHLIDVSISDKNHPNVNGNAYRSC